MLHHWLASKFAMFGALLALAGCSPPPGSDGEGAPDAPRVREYKREVRVYLREVRAGAKLLTLWPIPEKVKEKADDIANQRLQLPEAPPEVDKSGEIGAHQDHINGLFAVAVATDKDLANLPAERRYGALRTLADKLRERADAIEKKLDGK